MMPAVSRCPQCDAQVSIPRACDPSWRVRCPLCLEEFPLAEALDRVPPELIVVDRHAGLPAANAAAATTPWAELPAPVGAEVSVLPGSGPEPEIELERPATISAVESSKPAAHPLSAIDGAGVLRLSVAGASPGSAAMGRRAYRPAGRRRGRSFMGRLISVVGGAVVGLVMGYIALLWIGGPARDFLRFGGRLPAFLVPADFHPVVADAETEPGPSPNNGWAEPAAAVPSQNARRPSSGERSANGSRTADDRGRQPPPQATGVARPAAPRPELARPPVTSERTQLAAEPPAPPPLPVRNPPAFSVAELDRAVAAAQRVGHDLADGSLADVSARRSMGSAYRELCHLAERLTFPAPDADPAHVQQCRTAAADLVLGLVQIEGKSGDLGRIADYWIHSSKRSGNGVVLAGSVQSVQTAGSLSVLRMTLTGQRTVTVLTRGQVPVGPDEPAIVLGSIVEDPAANVVDYPGNEARIVWAGLVRPVAPVGRTNGKSS